VGQVDTLPIILEDGTVAVDVAFFVISYVVINVWTILQVLIEYLFLFTASWALSGRSEDEEGAS
jgi:hypothetical protein